MKDFGFRWLVILFLMGLCLPGTAQYFRQVGSYSDGMAVVQEYRPNVGRMNNYGYVNEYNKLVIPMKYGYAGDFNKGLAIVGVGIKRGLINKSGKIVLPIIYDAASFLVSSESEVVVKVTKDGKDGVAGKNGIILPCQFSWVCGGYVEGDGRKIIIAQIDISKFKLFELSGKPILPEGTYIYIYDKVISYDYNGTNYVFNTVTFRSLKDEKKGVFDVLNRKVLISPEYESIEPIGYGNYVVKKNGLYGVFNTDGDGKFIIPMQFDLMFGDVGHKNIKAYKGNEYAIYDYEGNEIMPFGCVKVSSIYDYDGETKIGDFVRKKGKYGMVLNNNQWALDAVYDTIIRAGAALVLKKNGNYGLSGMLYNGNYQIKEVLPSEYDQVRVVIDNSSMNKRYFFPYNKDGLWGMIASFSKSEYNLPLVFDEIEESVDYYDYRITGFMVKRDGKWGYYKVDTDYGNNKEQFDTKPQLFSYNDSYGNSYKLIIGCINGKYGISSLDGDVLIPFENDDIVGASDYCGVKKNGKWGLLQIDNSLSLTDYEQMEFIYDGIGRPSRFCPVRVKNKWGYCIDGKYAIKAQYDEAGEFINGRALVRKGKKEFYITENDQRIKNSMAVEDNRSRPVQRNWMIIGNYGLSNTRQHSWGCTVAFGAQFGFYTNMMAGNLLLFASSNPIITPEQQQDYFWNGESSTSRFSVTAGGTCAIGRMGYVYAGAGYGIRYLVWETMSGQHIAVSPGSFQGMAVETGLIFNLKNCRISVGGLKQLHNPYYELKFGIGMNINQ